MKEGTAVNRWGLLLWSLVVGILFTGPIITYLGRILVFGLGLGGGNPFSVRYAWGEFPQGMEAGLVAGLIAWACGGRPVRSAVSAGAFMLALMVALVLYLNMRGFARFGTPAWIEDIIVTPAEFALLAYLTAVYALQQVAGSPPPPSVRNEAEARPPGSRRYKI
jgi:hypothetical protein